MSDSPTKHLVTIPAINSGKYRRALIRREFLTKSLEFWTKELAETGDAISDLARTHASFSLSLVEELIRIYETPGCVMTADDKIHPEVDNLTPAKEG